MFTVHCSCPVWLAQAYQRSCSAADVPVVLDCGSAVWKCGFVPLVRYAPQRSHSTSAQQLRSPRTSLTDAQRLELLAGAAPRSPRSPRTSVSGQPPAPSRGLWNNAEPFELPAFVGRERFASAVMPAATGRRPVGAAAAAATVYVGHKALARKGVLHLRQPLDPSSGTLVERADAGREDLQHLTRYVFDTALPTLLANEAGVKLLTPALDDFEDEDADSFRVSFSLSPRARRFDSSLHPVLVAEPLPRAGDSEKIRAALAEQLFETHQVPAVSFQLGGLMATYDPFAWERVGGLADDPLLAEFLAFQTSPRRDPQVEMLASQWLHAEEPSGFTGVVLDMGHACTQVLPVVGGRALLDAAERVALAGHHVTSTLADLLRQQGARLQSPSEL